MFKKILVPMDLTERHKPALKIAAELAGSGGAVVLLHVVETILGMDPTEEPDFYQRLEKTARQHLQKCGKVLQQRGVPFCPEVLFGHRAAEISRYAKKLGMDLIILTAPRLHPEDPAGWGSLSYKVGILAPCPVLLVK